MPNVPNDAQYGTKRHKEYCEAKPPNINALYVNDITGLSIETQASIILHELNQRVIRAKKEKAAADPLALDSYFISTLPSTDVNSYSFEAVMSLVMKHREKELLNIEKRAVKDFGDKIIDRDVLSKLESNGQTVKRSNK